MCPIRRPAHATNCRKISSIHLALRSLRVAVPKPSEPRVSKRKAALLKLLQKSQISTCEQADVVNPVSHHRQARQPESECETAPLFRICSAVAQHRGMHQTARTQFHPTGVLAHRTAFAAADQTLNIQLEARFDERKKSWTQADGQVAIEDRREKRLH